MLFLLVIFLTAFLLAVSFIISAGFVWLVCWAFGFAFSWKVAVGVWAVMCLVSAAVKSSSGSGRE